MKLNAVAITLASVLSSSVMAVELKDFDFNPMIGVNVEAHAAYTNTPASPVLGMEVFYKDKYLVGGSMTSGDVKYNYSGGVYTEEHSTNSLWVGYKFDNDIALKLGGSRRSIESDVEVTAWFPSGHETKNYSAEYNINYAMVGIGYYGKNFNISSHMNFATSGDFNPMIDKTAYNHVNIMAGYKF